MISGFQKSVIAEVVRTGLYVAVGIELVVWV